MNAPTRPSPDISAVADALRPVLLRLGRRLRQEADHIGLSSLDATLLTMVANSPGIGVSELADQERTSRPTMSTHVTRLEAAGLLTRREPSAEDRRRVGLEITSKGAKAVDAVRRRRNDWLAQRLADLNQDDRDAVARALEPLNQISKNKR